MFYLYKYREYIYKYKFFLENVLCRVILKENNVNKGTLTELGLYLAKRSVNRAEVSRKTGLSTYRLSQLSINPKSQLRADELYLIALAIGEDPGTMFRYLYQNIHLPDDEVFISEQSKDPVT